MLKKLILSAAIIWTSIILILCLISLEGAPKVDVTNFDKYIHFSFHFIFTMLWFLFFKIHLKNENKYKPYLIAFVLSVLFGVLIEVLQQYCTESRAGDLFDVFANTCGATIAIVLFYTLDSFKILKNIS